MSTPRNAMAVRRHELLLDVEQSTKATALELGATHDLAEHLGAAVADMLLERWGGQQLTFPLNGHYGLSPREIAIVDRRDQGARVFEIAREFRMTERGVRKLLKRVDERLSQVSDQMDLFGDSSGQPGAR
ncbi:MAG: Mor transcription activator family protein [Lysobacteraceae bacterium]